MSASSVSLPSLPASSPISHSPPPSVSPVPHSTAFSFSPLPSNLAYAPDVKVKLKDESPTDDVDHFSRHKTPHHSSPSSSLTTDIERLKWELDRLKKKHAGDAERMAKDAAEKERLAEEVRQLRALLNSTHISQQTPPQPTPTHGGSATEGVTDHLNNNGTGQEGGGNVPPLSSSAAAAGSKGGKQTYAVLNDVSNSEGTFSCHRCKTKKDNQEAMLCTNESGKRKCGKKYCMGCLASWHTHAPSAAQNKGGSGAGAGGVSQSSSKFVLVYGAVTALGDAYQWWQPNNRLGWCCPACMGMCDCQACQEKYILAVATHQPIAGEDEKKKAQEVAAARFRKWQAGETRRSPSREKEGGEGKAGPWKPPGLQLQSPPLPATPPPSQHRLGPTPAPPNHVRGDSGSSVTSLSRQQTLSMLQQVKEQGQLGPAELAAIEAALHAGEVRGSPSPPPFSDARGESPVALQHSTQREGGQYYPAVPPQYQPHPPGLVGPSPPASYEAFHPGSHDIHRDYNHRPAIKAHATGGGRTTPHHGPHESPHHATQPPHYPITRPPVREGSYTSLAPLADGYQHNHSYEVHSQPQQYSQQGRQGGYESASPYNGNGGGATSHQGGRVALAPPTRVSPVPINPSLSSPHVGPPALSSYSYTYETDPHNSSLRRDYPHGHISHSPLPSSPAAHFLPHTEGDLTRLDSSNGEVGGYPRPHRASFEPQPLPGSPAFTDDFIQSGGVGWPDVGEDPMQMLNGNSVGKGAGGGHGVDPMIMFNGNSVGRGNEEESMQLSSDMSLRSTGTDIVPSRLPPDLFQDPREQGRGGERERGGR